MSLRTLGLNNSIFGLFQKTPKAPSNFFSVLDFGRLPQQSLQSIVTKCDASLGGKSTVAFDLDPAGKIGRFSGYLSLDLPPDNPRITRSGYAMFRTRDQRELWFSGNSYWNWMHMSLLVLRVKGDRRKYLVNLQANTPRVTDLFQHRLFLNLPGTWETVVIPLNDFVKTNWGEIQEGGELNKGEIRTFGIGLLDKQYGPYLLEIDWVKAMSLEEVQRLTLGHLGTNAAGAAENTSLPEHTGGNVAAIPNRKTNDGDIDLF